MKIDILTIFPDMFKSPFEESILRRAQDKSLVGISIDDLRKWTTDKHKTVDDKPFGGGAGMVMMVEPIYKALEELDPKHEAHRILFTAKGARIVQEKVQELSEKKHLILICGHYEGVDARVGEHLVDEQISIGDFVLTGGEIPAMALTDAVVRLLPGVLGNEGSVKDESFSKGRDTNIQIYKDTLRSRSTRLSSSQAGQAERQTDNRELTTDNYLEYPQYTRPATFKTKDGRELKVPEVLLSGNHKKVAKWREENRKAV
jgi:tRNA (guanine37-N1)-methyltransferase